MAAFAITSQISELDHFDIEISFEDFVKETQHKLLSTPNVQTDEEAAPVTCNLSSFMVFSCDTAEQEPSSIQVTEQEPTSTSVGEKVFEAVVTEEITNQVVKGMGYAIFGTTHLSQNQEKELLFKDMAEEDVALAVVHQDEFTEKELACLEVLENGFVMNQEQPSVTLAEDNFNLLTTLFLSHRMG